MKPLTYLTTTTQRSGRLRLLVWLGPWPEHEGDPKAIRRIVEGDEDL
jgi:hypothetical protein